MTSRRFDREGTTARQHPRATPEELAGEREADRLERLGRIVRQPPWPGAPEAEEVDKPLQASTRERWLAEMLEDDPQELETAKKARRTNKQEALGRNAGAEAEECWRRHLERRKQPFQIYGRAFPGPCGASGFESVPGKRPGRPQVLRPGDRVELPRSDALWPWARVCRVLSVDEATGTMRLRPEGWPAGALVRRMENVARIAYSKRGSGGDGQPEG